MAKRWKKQEITYLKRYAAKRRLAELAERFKTTEGEVTKKLDELALEAADYSRPVPKPDPAAPALEAGLAALYAGKWAAAEKRFHEAIEGASHPELRQRAAEYARVASQRRAKAEAADDPFLEAVYERNRGNLEAALELCRRGGRQSKDERFAHLAASIHAVQGDREEAMRFLELAIELNPENRVHAYHDPDFEELRTDPEFVHVFRTS